MLYNNSIKTSKTNLLLTSGTSTKNVSSDIEFMQQIWNFKKYNKAQKMAQNINAWST